MAKVGILVLGAFAPKIIDKFVKLYNTAQFKFFIHCDAKQDIKHYLADTELHDRAFVLKERVSVYWGGFSMIEATILLMKEALSDIEITHIALISDDTGPLVSPAEAFSQITTHEDRIVCWKVPDDHFYWAWFRGFYYFDSPFANPKVFPHKDRVFEDSDWISIQRLQNLRSKGKIELTQLWAGRQWWTLCRGSAEQIIDFIDKNNHYADSFRYSKVSDETIIPTTYRILFPDRPVLPSMIHCDFSRNPKPFIHLDYKDIPELSGFDSLFIRKIGSSHPHILDQISSRWPEGERAK